MNYNPNRLDDLSSPLVPQSTSLSLQADVVDTEATPSKPERSRSLDAFRGLTIIVMIFVDYAGDACNGYIGHSPWDRIQFADFVMPFFLFIVGVAMVMSQRSQNFPGKRLSLFLTTLYRAVKMFLLGVYLQGGPNISFLRIPGILQRIAFCQIVVAAIELGLPDYPTSDESMFRLFKKHAYRMAACMSVLVIYALMMYATDTGLPGCEVGQATPACNAAYYWDVKFVGYNHMYNSPTYAALPACSPCDGRVPGKPLPPNCPDWCVRHFDPEGSVTSFSAVGSLYFGALIGHIFLSTPGVNEPSERIRSMSYLGAVLLGIGTMLSLAGIPFNKNIYSLSYMFFMAGWSTLFLLGFWYVIDVKQIEKPFLPLIWNGLNAIFLFVVGACDILERLIKKWYYEDPDHTLIWYIQSSLYDKLGHDWALVTYALIKVTFFTIVAWWMQRNRWFIKL